MMTTVDFFSPSLTSPQGSRTPLNTGLRWAAGIVVGLLVWFIRIPDLSARQEHGAALILATIVLWLLRGAPQGGQSAFDAHPPVHRRRGVGDGGDGSGVPPCGGLVRIFKFGVASVVTTALGLGVIGVFYWQVTDMLH